MLLLERKVENKALKWHANRESFIGKSRMDMQADTAMDLPGAATHEFTMFQSHQVALGQGGFRRSYWVYGPETQYRIIDPV